VVIVNRKGKVRVLTIAKVEKELYDIVVNDNR